MSKVIFINESQLKLLKEFNEKKEVTYFEFFNNAKQFLKDLLNKPNEAEPNDFFKSNNISKDKLLHSLKDLGIIKSKERIDEVPKEDGSDDKEAKHFITYRIPRARFEEKMHELHKVLFPKEKSVDECGETNKEVIEEDGEGMGGATSCGNAMQGGGTNPDAGQFITPFGKPQRRSFYGDALKMNKDYKNKSISMHRVK